MRTLLAAGTAVVLLGAPSVWAGLDDDDKKWIQEVRPLLLEEEEEALGSLSAKPDRLEFRKIFWARRDPDLFTPENEFRDLYEKRRQEADERFAIGPAVLLTARPPTPPVRPLTGSGRRAAETAAFEEMAVRQYRDEREPKAGSLTDCGLFYIVLGEPDDKQARGRRGAVAWIYKERKSRFAFDETCMLPEGNEKIRRKAKEHAVAQPTIEYRVRGGELISTLADMMPKTPPVRLLLRTPRQDFPCATEQHYLKEQGGTRVVGLLRGDAAHLFREEAAGGKVRVVVRAEATRADTGGPAFASEREMLVGVEPNGTFVASYRLSLAPGSYWLKTAVLDANNEKGALIEELVHVPDFQTGTLTIGSILALQGVDESPRRDRRHPMEAFRIGDDRFVPRFGNVFSQSESVTVFYQFYDPSTDAAHRMPSAAARVRILRTDGTAVAEGPMDDFDTTVGGTVVGPLSLSKCAPGKYRIEVRVVDRNAGKAYTRVSAFEVKGEPVASAE
jgi:hypothetical protein